MVDMHGFMTDAEFYREMETLEIRDGVVETRPGITGNWMLTIDILYSKAKDLDCQGMQKALFDYNRKYAYAGKYALLGDVGHTQTKYYILTCYWQQIKANLQANLDFVESL